MVRTDLPPPQIAVQAAHAVVELARSGHIPPDGEHPHLILCQVDDESALLSFAHSLRARGIRFAIWAEPDRCNESTAIAAGPVFGADRRHFRGLPLLAFPERTIP